MSIKTLANKATAKFGRQVLIAQHHSPTFLVAAGVAGFGATIFFACRATLKLSDVLEKGEAELPLITTEDSDDKKKTFSIQVKTAIEVAKLYALPVALGVGSIACLTGSHMILKRRNAGLAAALAVTDKMFKDYRGRVVADQGIEKDREYLIGTTEQEVVVEGKNGSELETVKGYDVAKIKANSHSVYYRVFDDENPNWSDSPNEVSFFLRSAQGWLNDKLIVDGVVFLNEVYDFLGFPKTEAGQYVGWVKNPEKDENGNPKGDGYIDFGIWADGTEIGKQKILNGHKDAIILDFNVDGHVVQLLQKV